MVANFNFYFFTIFIFCFVLWGRLQRQRAHIERWEMGGITEGIHGEMGDGWDHRGRGHSQRDGRWVGLGCVTQDSKESIKVLKNKKSDLLVNKNINRILANTS